MWALSPRNAWRLHPFKLRSRATGPLMLTPDVAYAVAQYPMSWALQRFPLGRALAVCVILWGAMVMCLGAANNYAQLSALRFLLGWFESVVTPGFAIFTASWYLRKEQSLRQGLYYAMSEPKTAIRR